MPLSYKVEECMYFVGDNTFKSNVTGNGESQSSGCTKEWWNSQPNIDTEQGKIDAMSKIIDTDGAAIFSGNFDILDAGGSTVLVFDDDLPAQVDDGILINVVSDSNSVLDDGIGLYKITDRVTADTVRINAEVSGDSPGSFGKIGGAFPNIESVEDYVDVEKYNQEIHINKDTILDSAGLELSYWGNGLGKNASLIITGFNRTPGDTDYGGKYFQSIYDAKKNGKNPESFVELDATSVTASQAVLIEYCENIVFRGFDLINTPSGVSGIKYNNSCGFIFYHNLGYSTGNHLLVVKSAGYHAIIFDNFLKTDGFFGPQSEAVMTAFNNIIDSEWSGFNIKEYSVLLNNFVISEAFVANAAGVGLSFTKNNVFVKEYTSKGYPSIRIGASAPANYEKITRHFGMNNIMLVPDNTEAVVDQATSTYKYLDVTSFFENAYAQDDSTLTIFGNSEGGILSDGFIKEVLKDIDPQLDSDYKPLNETVRTGGMPNVINEDTGMGAVQNPDFPLASNVLAGDTVDFSEGTATVPDAGDVRSGITYGAGGDALTGNHVPADQADVLSGETYGAGGNEYTGTMVVDHPEPGNVTVGDTTGGENGTYEPASESDVILGRSYGANGTQYTGTLDAPAPPTIAVTLDGTTAAVAITGAAGATHYCKYKKTTESAWTDGGNRSGNGSISIAGLETGHAYIFMVYSELADVYSTAVADLAVLAAGSSGDYHTARSRAFAKLLEMFGESISYFPADGGAERPITAIVKRFETDDAVEIEIDAANDALTGITSAEIDTGGDKIALPVRIGETAQQRSIVGIKHMCASSMKLEIA